MFKQNVHYCKKTSIKMKSCCQKNKPCRHCKEKMKQNKCDRSYHACLITYPRTNKWRPITHKYEDCEDIHAHTKDMIWISEFDIQAFSKCQKCDERYHVELEKTIIFKAAVAFKNIVDILKGRKKRDGYIDLDHD
jgi:hypothetical protein